MSEQQDSVATCRWCRRELNGKPYYMGGSAFDPKTNERCKINFYGGSVCSRECDFKASLALEQTMPGHSGREQTISCHAQNSLANNWSAP